MWLRAAAVVALLALCRTVAGAPMVIAQYMPSGSNIQCAAQLPASTCNANFATCSLLNFGAGVSGCGQNNNVLPIGPVPSAGTPQANFYASFSVAAQTGFQIALGSLELGLQTYWTVRSTRLHAGGRATVSAGRLQPAAAHAPR